MRSRLTGILCGAAAVGVMLGAGAMLAAASNAQSPAPSAGASTTPTSAFVMPAGGTLLGDGKTKEFQTADGITYTVTPLAQWSDCPSGWVCLFETAGGGGTMWKFQNAGIGWQNLQNFGAYPFVSAVWNRRGYKVFLGSGTAGGGINGSGPLCYTSPTQVSYIGAVWNDKPRSINIVTNNTAC